MSPKKITQLGFITAAVSIVGLAGMAVAQPDWGILNWWPAMGLALALLLLVTSFLRGAYLTAQKRAEMVDKLNDCYMGNTEQA